MRYFEDILQSIGHIRSFVAGLDADAYKADLKTKSAVERQLQIITEAAYRLGEEVSTLCPGPNWRGMRGMGNILRHAYDQVSDTYLWNVVKNDLPILEQSVEEAIKVLQNQPE